MIKNWVPLSFDTRITCSLATCFALSTKSKHEFPFLVSVSRYISCRHCGQCSLCIIYCSCSSVCASFPRQLLELIELQIICMIWTTLRLKNKSSYRFQTKKMQFPAFLFSQIVQALLTCSRKIKHCFWIFLPKNCRNQCLSQLWSTKVSLLRCSVYMYMNLFSLPVILFVIVDYRKIVYFHQLCARFHNQVGLVSFFQQNWTFSSRLCLELCARLSRRNCFCISHCRGCHNSFCIHYLNMCAVLSCLLEC